MSTRLVPGLGSIPSRSTKLTKGLMLKAHWHRCIKCAEIWPHHSKETSCDEPERCPKCRAVLTKGSAYYIVEIDTLVEESAYDNHKQHGIKSYSVISVDDDGAFEIDRAYRTVKEALRAWPEAIPPVIRA